MNHKDTVSGIVRMRNLPNIYSYQLRPSYVKQIRNVLKAYFEQYEAEIIKRLSKGLFPVNIHSVKILERF